MSSDTGGGAVDAPIRIRVHAGRRLLELHWADAGQVLLAHGRLRSACKCAWCEQGRRQNGVDPAASDDVHLTGVERVGAVGLQLRFSDGHDKGIYPWSYLRSLAA